MDANLLHLEKVKNVAVKLFFDQYDETVLVSNEEEVIFMTTPSPTNNYGTNIIINTQGLIPLNTSKVVLSSDDDDDEIDEKFGTRSRSSLDKSNAPQNQDSLFFCQDSICIYS